jgi:hypothetical protein
VDADEASVRQKLLVETEAHAAKAQLAHESGVTATAAFLKARAAEEKDLGSKIKAAKKLQWSEAQSVALAGMWGGEAGRVAVEEEVREQFLSVGVNAVDFLRLALELEEVEGSGVVEEEEGEESGGGGGRRP